MKVNNFKIFLIIILCYFLLESCTILITEALRKNSNLFDDTLSNDTTGYFVPNTDYAFANIDSIVNRNNIGNNNSEIDSSNFENFAEKYIPNMNLRLSDINFQEIDSVLKNSELDSLGQVKYYDTTTDSKGKQVVKETIYSKDKEGFMSKEETFFDNKNDTIETMNKVYNAEGVIVSSEMRQREHNKILGIIPHTKKRQVNTEYIKLDTNTPNYNITLTNLDDSYYPDSIILNVSVQNKDGEFISGLAPPYISKDKNYHDYWQFVNENCKDNNVAINNFRVEEIRDVKQQKNNICFVLDHSGSMGEQRCMNLQQAVYYVSRQVNEEDYLSAIKFTDRSTVEVEPTDNKELFRKQFKINGMSSGKYGGGTDILLAIDSAISVLLRGPDDYNKIVILFTDGESNMKRLQNVMKQLVANKCKVFTICYGRVDMKVMRQIANGTFGRTYKIRDVKDFADVFKEIYNTLTNYYKIVYTPLLCADLHKVSVDLELPKLNFISSNFRTESIKLETEYDKSVLSDYADIGTMTLLDIEFEYNKAEIDSSSISILLDIAAQLKRNKNVNIQIAGHTDDIGNDDYNQKLSLARANSVKDFLVTKGINKSRIKTIGYGKSQPLFPNDSDENRRKNRRTEFVVVE